MIQDRSSKGRLLQIRRLSRFQVVYFQVKSKGYIVLQYELSHSLLQLCRVVLDHTWYVRFSKTLENFAPPLFFFLALTYGVSLIT